MKSILFLFLLTTLAAAIKFDADGTVACTSEKCIFTMHIIEGDGNPVTFNGESNSIGTGLSKLEGTIDTDSLRRLKTTTNFDFILNPDTAKITFKDEKGGTTGYFDGSKTNRRLTGKDHGDGTWK